MTYYDQLIAEAKERDKRLGRRIYGLTCEWNKANSYSTVMLFMVYLN